jgi:3-dehydroquinate dehydratase-1
MSDSTIMFSSNILSHKESNFGICVSVFAKNLSALRSNITLAKREKPDLIEVRLDYLRNLNRIDSLERTLKLGNILLTFRRFSEGGANGRISESQRVFQISKLLSEVEPDFLDIEIKTLQKHPEILKQIEHSNFTRLIASFHDLEGNSSSDDLLNVVVKAPLQSNSLYAVKVVRLARSFSDNFIPLSLYSRSEFKRRRSPKLIAFCTGEVGKISRVLSVFAGSPLVYCSLLGKPAAAGQPTIKEFKQMIRKIRSMFVT